MKKSLYNGLHYAALKGDLVQLEQALQEYEINSQTEDGHTALAISCQIGNLKLVQILLSKGARVDLADIYLRLPIHWAALKQDQPEIVDELLMAGSPPNAVTVDGLTPLHYASILGHLLNVEALLKKGADPKLIYSERTPRELAAVYGHEEVAKLFRDCDHG